MEILSAVLTALFLWLLLAHGAVARKAFQRRAAGVLVLRIQPRERSLARLVVWLLVALGVLVAIPVYDVWAGGHVGDSAELVFWAFLLVLCGAGSSEFARALELHQNGLVRCLFTSADFSSWSEIRYCQWVSGGGVLRVETSKEAEEYRVRADQRDAVTDVLARHVQVLDEQGNRIAPEKRSAACGDRPDGGAPKPRFPWYQFSLRTLLLAVVVAAAASSWYAQRKHRLDRWRPVAEKLAALGAPYVDPSGAGRSLFFQSTGLTFSDDDLSLLDEFPRLERLEFLGVPITDAGLAHVARRKTLVYLCLQGTRVSDAGMVHLEGLDHLKELNLSFTPLTDASVGSLAKLRRLKRLNLVGTKISPDGVLRLRLALPNTEITSP